MKYRPALILFGLLCLAQLAVPVCMIQGQERVLRDGELFRFRTAPVDPYDAFRGRYVELDFDFTTVEVDDDRWHPGDVAFAPIEVDADGFAGVTGLLPEAPTDAPYLKLRVGRSWGTDAWLDVPFDRYYMDEYDAPRAEEIVRESTRDEDADVWVEVRVLDGRAVIEELYVDGRPIRTFLNGDR